MWGTISAEKDVLSVAIAACRLKRIHIYRYQIK
jgi:hypothetical protein